MTENLQYGKRVFLYFCLFFAVILIANGFLLYFSWHNQPDILAKNGYVASIDFAKQDKQLKQQAP